jgi:hypothetical protein
VIAVATAPIPDLVDSAIVRKAGVSEAVRRASGGKTATTASARATEAPHTIRNGAANPSTSAVTPPSAGPAIEPTLVAASATPIDSPRFPGGARSDTTASAAIQLAAEPSPWTARPAISTSSDSVTAIRPEPAPVSSRPPTSSHRLPTMSAARPRGSENSITGTA